MTIRNRTDRDDNAQGSGAPKSERPGHDPRPSAPKYEILNRIYDNLRKCSYLDAEHRDSVLLAIRNDADALAALSDRAPTRDDVIEECARFSDQYDEPKELLPKPTIADLEKMLNGDEPAKIQIRPDGSIWTGPSELMQAIAYEIRNLKTAPQATNRGPTLAGPVAAAPNSDDAALAKLCGDHAYYMDTYNVAFIGSTKAIARCLYDAEAAIKRLSGEREG